MSTEDAATYRLDRRLLMIAGVAVLGAIMTILDTTIMGVAINTLARVFDTSARSSGRCSSGTSRPFWWPLATAAIGTLAALLMIRDRIAARAGAGSAASRKGPDPEGPDRGATVDIGPAGSRKPPAPEERTS